MPSRDLVPRGFLHRVIQRIRLCPGGPCARALGWLASATGADDDGAAAGRLAGGIRPLTALLHALLPIRGPPGRNE